MLEIDFRKSVVDSGMDTRVDNAITFGDEIERLGYGGLWHGHSIITDVAGLDTFSMLTAVAARTQRIIVGSAVVQAPLYHPLEFARRIITLDHVSNGRFLLGVGTGGFDREFIKLGIPYKERPSRTDETLEILKKVCTQDGYIDHEGQYFNFKELVFLPKPIHKPHPKILIGGVWRGSLIGRVSHSGSNLIWSEKAITRVAKYGDGWITGSTIPPDQAADVLVEAMQRFRERAKEYGRVINDDDFYLVAETGMINVQDSKGEALEESAQFYSARVARGFHQSRGNPSMETHLTTGSFGEAEEVAEFMLKWIAVKKRVPALKRIQVNLAALPLVSQLRRFHEKVYPLIERELKAAQ